MSHLQEPILALRRQLAVLSGAEKEAGLCWLQQAKICRVTGHFEAACTAGLEALSREVPGAVIEHAKLLWETDQPYRAIARLQQVHIIGKTSVTKACPLFAKQMIYSTSCLSFRVA